MIRPIDLHTAWQALPGQAEKLAQERASLLYQSIQHGSKAAERNLQGTQSITKGQEAKGSFFYFLQSQHKSFNYRLEEMERRYKARKELYKQAQLYALESNKMRPGSAAVPGIVQPTGLAPMLLSEQGPESGLYAAALKLLFYSNGLGQISGLIWFAAPFSGNVVGKELQGQYIQDRTQQRKTLRNRETIISLLWHDFITFCV